MDEKAAIAAAKQGDTRAFNSLVFEYQNLAYNIAYRILADSDAAADACQDAFLSAFKNMRCLRGAAFKPWLLRIVTNACYDQLRRRKRRPAESLDDMLEADPDHNPLLRDPAPLPEQHALRHELEDTIMAGIRTLPDDQRVTLVLADVQGFDYQEIAAITSTSLGTVKSRLSRARAKLRDYLVAHGELIPAHHRPKDDTNMS